MTQNKREQAFIGKLSTIVDIAHQDAIKIMKSEIYNDENIAFLEDQRDPREKYIRSVKRKKREEAIKQKEQSKENDKKDQVETNICDLISQISATDGDSEEYFMCLKKVGKDKVIMVPIYRKNGLKM